MADTGRSCRSPATPRHGWPRGWKRGVAVLESLADVGSLTAAPWIYAAVGLSVLLDVFLPVLPSGVLVITAATAAAAGSGAATGQVPDDVPDILALTLCAATASVLGDLVAYRLAWRGGPRLDRALARSRRLASAQERLGAALSRGGGRPRRPGPLRPRRPLPGLLRRRRHPPQPPRLPALVRRRRPRLGRLQRGPRLPRRPVAGCHLGRHARLGGGTLRRRSRGHVPDAPQPGVSTPM
ncbi:hypothetical protein RKD41_002235 [Streptomyces tendae]